MWMLTGFSAKLEKKSVVRKFFKLDDNALREERKGLTSKLT